MIGLLLRRHLANPAVVVFALLGLTFMGLPNEVSPVPVLVLALVAWRVVPQRVDELEASLPIRGRDVVMARVLAALAVTLIPAACWLGIAIARGDATQALPRVLGSVFLSALIIAAPQMLDPGLGDRSFAKSPVVAWSILALFAAGTLVLVPAAAPLVFGSGAVAAFLAIWMRTPDALTLAPARASAGPSVAALPRDDSVVVPDDSVVVPDDRVVVPSEARDLHLRLPGLGLLRSILPWHAVFFWLIVIWGSALTSDYGLLYFWIAMVQISATVRMRTIWLATLPLSHRARLLAIVVPAVVVTAGCVAIGSAAGRALPFNGYSLTRDGPSPVEGGYGNLTNVSIEHWRRAPIRTAPVITAPWGEQVVADTATVFGTTLYNPWTTSRASTPRFVDWQFQRATAEVHGRPLTVEQYEAGRPHPRAIGDVRTWMVRAVLLLVIGLGFLMLAEVGYSHRRRTGSRMRLVVQGGGVLLVTVLIASGTLYRVRGGAVVYPLLRRGLVELGNRLPSNPALALVVVALPVVAAYALLERQFRRSEPALVVRKPGW